MISHEKKNRKKGRRDTVLEARLLCFVIPLLCDMWDLVFILASTKGKSDLPEEQPKIKANFKVITFASNIAKQLSICHSSI